MKSILLTICARGGSKGLPNKNISIVGGIPLIAHSILQAKKWGKARHIVVSTDSRKISRVAKTFGAEVPFLRPRVLATDDVSKLPVLTHALIQSEKIFNTQFDIVVDLDPTAPVRRQMDFKRALEVFVKFQKPVCFSVTKARKNPYFNMVEKSKGGVVSLSKKLPRDVFRRQDAPEVWDMNASIYVYDRKFLLTHPKTFWNVETEIIPMDPECAFDIDLPRDRIIVEALMQHYNVGNPSLVS
jgi:CMP-N,N'-diacetyllegionaminic acid synthase